MSILKSSQPDHKSNDLMISFNTPQKVFTLTATTYIAKMDQNSFGSDHPLQWQMQEKKTES